MAPMIRRRPVKAIVERNNGVVESPRIKVPTHKDTASYVEKSVPLTWPW